MAAYILLGWPGAIAAKRNAHGNYWSINDFGGIADGTTDNGPAFRRAFAALAAKGGGTLYIPAATQPYVVSTADSVAVDGFRFVALIPSNVHITGNGSIKLGDGVNSTATPAQSHKFGLQMFGNAPGASNIEIDGITLDLNGAHNLQPAKSEVHPQYGFRFTAHGVYSEHISVHDITIKNCAGNNMIVFQGAAGRFASVMHCVLAIGGKGIAVNIHNVDFSFIYTEWEHSRINQNMIYQDPANTGASGGIELHNGKSEALENTIRNCYPGILLQSTPGAVMNVAVKGNIITGGFSGISLWAGVMPFRSVRISGNHITLQYNPALAARFGESYGIGQPFLAARSLNRWTDTTANGVTLQDLAIVRNSIAMITPPARTDSDSLGVTLNGGRNILIRNNTISYMSGAGINLYSSAHGTVGIRIEDNRVLNCGDHPVTYSHSGIRLDFDPLTPASSREKVSYSGASIRVINNYIQNTAVSGTHTITVLGSERISNLAIHGNERVVDDARIHV